MENDAPNPMQTDTWDNPNPTREVITRWRDGKFYELGLETDEDMTAPTQ